MNTALRPLELRLTAERDLVATRTYETESRRDLAARLAETAMQGRRRLAIIGAIAVLAVAVFGVAYWLPA